LYFLYPGIENEPKITNKFKSRVLLFFLFVFICVFWVEGRCFFSVAFASDAFGGSANYSYKLTETTTDGEKESSWQQTQNYKLGVRKDFTDKVNFTADVDVNITNNDGKETTSLVPDLRLDVNNEYFNANTGYRRTERNINMFTVNPEQERITTESWNINLDTKSITYPQLRLSYSEDVSYDHLEDHETDNKSTLFNSRLDYDYRFLDFSYSFKRNTSENYVTDLTQETNTHEGMMSFNRNFFDDKVTTSGRYSILFSETESQTQGSEVTVEDLVAAAHGLYADDFPLPGVALGTLDSLVDGDRTTSTGKSIGGFGKTDRNIGLDLNLDKTISQIRLYTEDVSFTSTAFTWAVYYSDDNVNYTKITNAATFSYDDDENYFEINFNATEARYFKIVNKGNDSTVDPINVTEIEAYEVTTYAPNAVTTQERTTQNLQTSIGYKPFDWMQFNYDLSWNEQETKPDSEKTSQTTHNFSARVERRLHQYLRAVGQYQRRMQVNSDSADTANDTFLVHFTSSPLDTLSTGLSLSHNISQTENVVQSKNTQALMQAQAKLREGLDWDVDCTATNYQNVAGDSETNTQSLSSGLRMELTPNLTDELEYDVQWSETDAPAGTASTQSSSAKNTLYWRPSSDFFFRGSYSMNWEDSGEESTQQQYNISWLMTDKMQLSLGYTLDENGGTSQTLSSDLSWNLSSMFTLKFGFNWSRQETDTVTDSKAYTVDISARF